MTTFATLEFYQTEYLQGDTQVVPDTAFMRLATKASEAINLRTSERAETMGVIDEKTDILNFPITIKRCTCELAEFYFRNEQANSSGAIQSMGAGRASLTFVNQRRQQAELNRETEEIFRRHLNNVLDGTGTLLLYRG